MSTHVDDVAGTGFGAPLAAARTRAGLSTRQLARRSGVDRRRLIALERGESEPTERELGVLAHACDTTVFALLPPGYGVEVLSSDEVSRASGAGPVAGSRGLDALLREYLSMVVELRSGRTVTAPSLRHDDLVELAAALGDTPAAIEARLVTLLGAPTDDAPAIRSMILPSTAA